MAIPWENILRKSKKETMDKTKYIYKIINLINLKVYIGQSNNPKRRLAEHINGRTGSIIHSAICKYGQQNFLFEIIEGPIENYNMREQYWINFYKAQNRDFGYNLLIGGENPPVILGEKNSFCLYSNQFVNEILIDLQENLLSYLQISNKYKISQGYLYRLNIGKIRKKENLVYPIRKQSNIVLPAEIVTEIEKELLYSHKPIDQLSKQLDVSQKTICKINFGLHKNNSGVCDYPIREKYKQYSTFLIRKIVDAILSQENTFAQIEKLYDVPHVTLSKINKGAIYKQPDLIYPLRRSTNRVYKPVETIPG